MGTIAGVILAGGRARRMSGADKPLLPLAGRPLLTHVIERLRPQVSAIVLNANGDPLRFGGFGLDVVADADQSFSGPLAGILAGLRWARGLATPPMAIVTAAADTPFFPGDLVERLCATAGDGPDRIVIAATAGNPHPTFGLWPLFLENDLEAFIAAGSTLKVRAFVDRHDGALAEFPVAGPVDPFFNVNTPDDLEAAERIAGAMR